MMEIKPFFDERTWTMTYVVHDPETSDAIVVDPVLDYDPNASRTWTESVDEVVRFIREQQLTLRMVLETHAHADHISGAQMLRDAFPGAVVAIGERITDVQKMFKSIFNLPAGFATDGSQFDRLLKAGEEVQVGSLSFTVLPTPGHTPACVSYLFGDAVFTGDALFMPDVGTGRCDFPGGSADDLYHSVTEVIYGLPDQTRVLVGHDYPDNREVAWEATVAEHRAGNVALPASRSREDFVAWRNRRDASLAAPRLLFQSVQVNIDAGQLPDPSDNEIRYLRIPLNVFRPKADREATTTLEEVSK